jgi:hypothetical protein
MRPRAPRRPKAILWFECLSLGALALGIVESWLAWDQLVPLRAPDSRRFFYFVTAPGLTLVVIATLTLRVSLGRSKIAMWLLVGLFVLTLPDAIMVMSGSLSPHSPALSGIQLLGRLVALVLLFTRPARRWMDREPEIDLNDVFA